MVLGLIGFQAIKRIEDTKMISKIGIMAGALLCGLSMTAAAQNICPPRPTYGDAVVNPPEVSSQNGTLTLNLAENSSLGPTQMVLCYCYVYNNGGQNVEAPTLPGQPWRQPGDQLHQQHLDRRRRGRSAGAQVASRSQQASPWKWAMPKRPRKPATTAWGYRRCHHQQYPTSMD